MTLENYEAEIVCLNESKLDNMTLYEYEMKLFKKQKKAPNTTPSVIFCSHLG